MSKDDVFEKLKRVENKNDWNCYGISALKGKVPKILKIVKKHTIKVGANKMANLASLFLQDIIRFIQLLIMREEAKALIYSTTV